MGARKTSIKQNKSNGKRKKIKTGGYINAVVCQKQQ